MNSRTEYQKQWREDNKEKLREYWKDYRKKQGEKLTTYQREYKRQYRKRQSLKKLKEEKETN